MTFQTFKNDIKNNNITDFTPYLDVKYTEHYRAEMIKNNILFEKSVARKEQIPLIAAIEKVTQKHIMKNGLIINRHL